jgi:hypothetical protein
MELILLGAYSYTRLPIFFVPLFLVLGSLAFVFIDPTLGISPTLFQHPYRVIVFQPD